MASAWGSAVAAATQPVPMAVEMASVDTDRQPSVTAATVAATPLGAGASLVASSYEAALSGSLTPSQLVKALRDRGSTMAPSLPLEW